MTHWLEKLYELDKINKDKALDLLFDKIDEMLLRNNIIACDDLLQEIDLDRLSITLWLGLLAITLQAASKLPYRPILYKEIETRLRAKEPERVERLLSGLKLPATRKIEYYSGVKS